MLCLPHCPIKHVCLGLLYQRQCPENPGILSGLPIRRCQTPFDRLGGVLAPRRRVSVPCRLHRRCSWPLPGGCGFSPHTHLVSILLVRFLPVVHWAPLYCLTFLWAHAFLRRPNPLRHSLPWWSHCLPLCLLFSCCQKTPLDGPRLLWQQGFSDGQVSLLDQA